MRILMRNTVFKTATLAGLFLCMLALAGAFSGITTSAHATHADGVQAQEDLQPFVEAAIDAYYIDFIMKQGHCDFTGLTVELGGTTLDGATINGLLPGLPTAQIKSFIPQFGDLDMGEYCDLTQPFSEVFGRTDGDWKSGSIYLFVMDENGEMLYNGGNQSLEGTTIQAIDEGDRDILKVITDAVGGTPSGTSVEYCWDDPTVDTDDVDGNAMMAPGVSWKISYVVDPFESLGTNPPMNSPGVIFGSSIYPKTGTPLSGCQICTDSGCSGDDMGPGDGGMEPGGSDGMEPSDGGMEPGPVTSVSGGGCAIAAGSDSTTVLLSSNAFNLLLIVSALFFTVSFGSRAAGRRNGIRS